MDVHYYLISRKRGHTKNVRLRDHIGLVICDSRYPPFQKGTAKMSKVDWWHGYQTPNTACTGLATPSASESNLAQPANQ